MSLTHLTTSLTASADESGQKVGLLPKVGVGLGLAGLGGLAIASSLRSPTPKLWTLAAGELTISEVAPMLGKGLIFSAAALMAVHLCDKPGESHERNFLMDAGATMGTTIGYLSAKEAGAGLAGFGLRGLGAGAVGLGVGYLAYEGVHYLSTHGYLGKTSDRTGV